MSRTRRQTGRAFDGRWGQARIGPFGPSHEPKRSCKCAVLVCRTHLTLHKQLDKLRRLPKPCRRAGDPPIFFAFASGLPDPPQDTSGHAVATVDVAELCGSIGITAGEVLKAAVRFTLSTATELTESSSAKRPRDAGPSTRASNRRATGLGGNGSERILRQSTIRQRRGQRG